MYTRGQFAVMGNVGRKALRLYHEEGLLVPVYINKDNGYHYYDGKQLETLEKIKQLRRLGLSLFEIRQILDGKVREQDIIDSRINETGRLLSDMKEYISAAAGGSEAGSGNIDFRPFDRCRCICISENTEREELGMSIGRLYERASRESIDIAGDHFVIYDGLYNDDSFSMTTCLPVSGCTCDDISEIYEGKCIHLSFRGGFSKVWQAHRMLRDYADEEHIALSDRIYEVYHKDMSVDVYYAVK